VAIASAQRGASRAGLFPGGPRRQRRRPARGDLRRPRRRRPRCQAGRGLAPRPHARPGRRRPSPQRSPGRRRGRSTRPKPGPDHRRRLAGDRPQPQGQADRGPSVVPSGFNAARHDHGHGRAVGAQVAPAADQGLRRHVADRDRATDHPVAQTVAVQTKPATHRPTGRIAPRTPSRPGLLDRGRSMQPSLDVDVAVDDERGALGCRHTRGDRGHDAVGVRAPSASPTFGGRHAQPRRTRSHRPRPSGPRPTLADGVSGHRHHSARSAQPLFPSSGPLANSGARRRRGSLRLASRRRTGAPPTAHESTAQHVR